MKQPSNKTIVISVCVAVCVMLSTFAIAIYQSKNEGRASLAAQIERELSKPVVAEY